MPPSLPAPLDRPGDSGAGQLPHLDVEVLVISPPSSP